ncbi:Holliday junction resolvase RuvX [Candidatus Woesebacteria bacterium]|nr:Holliday junction resolvase RuvX [Candidatus Woesebacteria bacterium]
MEQSYKKILGIDFGTVRVGVAVSYGTLAEPLKIVANDEFLYENLKKIIEEHRITQIIVGISEHKSAERTRAFVNELSKHTTLPIEFTDETLTTQAVRAKLKETGMLASQVHTARVDHLAAAELLQEWLDINE